MVLLGHWQHTFLQLCYLTGEERLLQSSFDCISLFVILSDGKSIAFINLK